MNQDPSQPVALAGQAARARRATRLRRDRLFVVLCWFAASLSTVILFVLLASIGYQGSGHVSWDFLTSFPSRNAEEAGISPALWGTIWVCAVCALTAIPLGVGTAVFLEEFQPKNAVLRRIHAFVQINIANLAGVPSIVYGLLGLTAFVQMFGYGNALEPAFTLGQKWYDVFIDEGGSAVQVRVDFKDAPPIALSPDLPFTDIDGDPIEVRIVEDSSTLDPIRDEIGRVVAAFDEALTAALGSADPADAASVDRAVDAALAAVQMRASKAEVRDAVIALLSSGYDTFVGREGRRASRRARSEVQRLEGAARLGGTLLASAPPQRQDSRSFYYFQIPFGRGVLAGGLTLMLVVLPVVIVSSQEALRAVPRSLRQGSLALGATPWQTIWNMTLPAAVPGIMTGTILAMSRAIGEAAPILVLAGIVFIMTTPQHLMDEFTAMPLQIYNWASRPQTEFHDVAAAGIIVLLAVLLTFNALAVFIRYKFQRPLS